MFDSENAERSSETVSYAAIMSVNVLEVGENVFEVTCPDTYVGQGQKNVKLRWEMKTEGWEVIGVYGLTDPVFVDKAKDGIDYKCKDKNDNSSETDYKYTVIVGNPETKKVASLDPTIKNGGIQ
jgi:hypothetical protein